MDTNIKNTPLISVIMPVYNGEKFIHESVESVRGQTYKNWELIIYDDASKDGTLKIIQEFSKNDLRVKIIEGKENKGQSVARNTAIAASHGEYLALLDADDIALPSRLEVQNAYMETHTDIAMLGSWVVVRDERGAETIYQSETDPDIIAAGMLFNAMVINSSVMIRKSFLERHRISYDESSSFLAEDYALWVKCAEKSKIKNLPRVLTIYRKHGGSISQEQKTEHRARTARVQKEVLQNLSIDPTATEMALHGSVYTKSTDADFAQKELMWLKKIKKANDARAKYAPAALGYVLEKVWYTVCGNHPNFKNFLLFVAHPFGSIGRHCFLCAKLLAKCTMTR